MLNKRSAMVIRGTLIHTPVFAEVDIVEEALIAIDDNGQISTVDGPEPKAYEDILSMAKANNNLVELKKSQFLLPGLVDLHIHAPQRRLLQILINQFIASKSNSRRINCACRR